MKTHSKLAVAAGAVVLLIAGAAVARSVAQGCCKDDCCDELASPQAPAPTPQA